MDEAIIADWLAKNSPKIGRPLVAYGVHFWSACSQPKLSEASETSDPPVSLSAQKRGLTRGQQQTAAKNARIKAVKAMGIGTKPEEVSERFGCARKRARELMRLAGIL